MEIGKLERQVQSQAALQALLHRIGDQVIFIGEGSGATMAWLATDVAPKHVACVIAVEPSGPPFGDHKVKIEKSPPDAFQASHPFIKENEEIETRTWDFKCTYKGSVRRYGLADIPLTYDPPVEGPTSFFEELTGVDETTAGLVPPKASVGEEARKPIFNLAEYHCPDDPRKTAWLQTVKESDDEPVLDEHGKEYPPESQPGRMKKLVHLSKVPHAVVTAQASSHAIYDWATVTFMKQAGCDVTWLKLADSNIVGNGHLMFLETNSTEIADAIHAWFTQRLEEARPAARPATRPEPVLTRVTAYSTPIAPPTAPTTPFASTAAADLPRSHLSGPASSLVSRALAGLAASHSFTPSRAPTATSALTTAAPTPRVSVPTTTASTPAPAGSAPASRVSTPAPVTPAHAMLTPAVRSLALSKPIMSSSGTAPAVKSSALGTPATASTRTTTPQAVATTTAPPGPHLPASASGTATPAVRASVTPAVIAAPTATSASTTTAAAAAPTAITAPALVVAPEAPAPVASSSGPAQPVRPQPVVAQTSTTQPAIAQPVPVRLASVEPAPVQPSTTQPVPAQPAVSQPAVARPTPVQPVPVQHAVVQPTTEQPDVVQSVPPTTAAVASPAPVASPMVVSTPGASPMVTSTQVESTGILPAAAESPIPEVAVAASPALSAPAAVTSAAAPALTVSTTPTVSAPTDEDIEMCLAPPLEQPAPTASPMKRTDEGVDLSQDAPPSKMLKPSPMEDVEYTTAAPASSSQWTNRELPAAAAGPSTTSPIISRTPAPSPESRPKRELREYFESTYGTKLQQLPQIPSSTRQSANVFEIPASIYSHPLLDHEAGLIHTNRGAYGDDRPSEPIYDPTLVGHSRRVARGDTMACAPPEGPRFDANPRYSHARVEEEGQMYPTLRATPSPSRAPSSTAATRAPSGSTTPSKQSRADTASSRAGMQRPDQGTASGQHTQSPHRD